MWCVHAFVLCMGISVQRCVCACLCYVFVCLCVEERERESNQPLSIVHFAVSLAKWSHLSTTNDSFLYVQTILPLRSRICSQSG